MDHIQEKLLELLKDAPRGLSTTELSRRINESGISISRVSVRKSLLELFGSGLIQRSKVGVAKVWYITDTKKKRLPAIDQAEWKIIDRIFTFLENQHKRWIIQEIADNFGMNRNTITNILRVMAQLGLVEEHEQGRNSLWNIAIPQEMSRPTSHQMVVVLVELLPITNINQITLQIISLNSIAKRLAHLEDSTLNSLTLGKLETTIFQRPILESFLTSQIQSRITQDSNLSEIKPTDMSEKMELPMTIPKLEPTGISYWNASAQLEVDPKKNEGKNLRFILTYIDISLRFRMKYLIWRSTHIFRNLFTSLPLPIVLITPDFQVIDGNDEYKRIISHSEQFWGYHCFSLFRGKSQPCDDCPIIRNKLPMDLVTENSYLKVDGKEFIYQPGSADASAEFKMRVLVNQKDNTHEVTSYFLILVPKTS